MEKVWFEPSQSVKSYIQELVAFAMKNEKPYEKINNDEINEIDSQIAILASKRRKITENIPGQKLIQGILSVKLDDGRITGKLTIPIVIQPITNIDKINISMAAFWNSNSSVEGESVKPGMTYSTDKNGNQCARFFLQIDREEEYEDY